MMHTADFADASQMFRENECFLAKEVKCKSYTH